MTLPPVTSRLPVPPWPTTSLSLLAHKPLDTVTLPMLPPLEAISPVALVTLPPVTSSVPLPFKPTFRSPLVVSVPAVVTASVAVSLALVATVAVS